MTKQLSSVANILHIFNVCVKYVKHALIWPRGYKTFFMLNSTEHEIFLLIYVKMQHFLAF